MNNLQAVGPNRAAGFRDFDDRIDQSFGGFGLGGAPGKFHCHGNISFGEVALGEIDHLRGNSLAFEVFDFFDR